MNNPVSVIIPTYNRRAKIVDSIESVLNQTYKDIEVLVVDDGSVDDTEQVVNAIVQNVGECLKYFKLDSNHGTAFARNFGVSKAKYNIIAFNDSDDLWYSEKLARQIDFWEKNQDCKLVYCAYALKARHEDQAFRKTPEAPIDSLESGESTFLQLLYHNTIGTPTIMLDKETFLSIGGFDTSLSALEDWDLAVRMSIVGKIRYLDEILVSVYGGIDEGRMSLSKEKYYKNRCKMLSKYKDVLIEGGLLDVYIQGVMEKATEDAYIEYAKDTLKEYGF